MHSLVLKDGPLAGQRFPVDSQLVVGRVDADVTIDDSLVSGRHALVRPVEAGLEIEDLGSLNGTWVNGERITKRRLSPGDVIRLGATSLEVEGDRRTILAPSPQAMTSASPPPRAVAAADEEPSAPGTDDELRPVTALFADIVGSTSLGERLPPQEVKALVGECVTRMSRAVEQFGGTVTAYMGDGIAAFFGVPSAHEDDPERAARAALRVIEVVRDYTREVEAAWGIPNFSARVGINTGETAVGVVGAADPQSVSLGDTPNVAARLQGVAEPGTIVVGEATAKPLLHRFVLEPLGEVRVKGRETPVGAWRLVCAHAATRVTAPAPLVNREPEVARLQVLLDELAAGRGQILLLLGDAGIGKTRLLTELRTLAAERATWLEGHCLSYGTELLYGPLVEILRGWLGVEDGEAELSVRTKLRAKLGLMPASELTGVMPYLARMLSVKLDSEVESQLLRLPPDVLSAEIRRAYRAWVESIAQNGPVVMAIEDVHWADPATGALAEDFLELVDLAPILFVATLRVDPGTEGWRLRVRAVADYAHRTLELPLGPLLDPAARELLAQLPRSGELGESELEQIIAAAEGNPLYLEELLSAFVENRGLRRTLTWAPTVTGRRVLTATLESLLLARIDRLEPGARRLAQIAAVIGRSFPIRVLEHVVDSADFHGDLAVLLRADVIRELRRYPEPEYVFRNGLLREAALSTLPPARKHELYGLVGAACETLFAASLDDRLELLAHYFALSDELDKALDYLERAAERATRLDAKDHAAELWRRALKVASKRGDREAEERVKARLGGLSTQLEGRPREAGSTQP